MLPWVQGDAVPLPSKSPGQELEAQMCQSLPRAKIKKIWNLVDQIEGLGWEGDNKGRVGVVRLTAHLLTPALKRVLSDRGPRMWQGEARG